MKTAVDTNILLDVLLPEPAYLVSSAQAIRDARQHGPLVICELVYAELATQFSNENELNEVLVRAASIVNPSPCVAHSQPVGCGKNIAAKAVNAHES